MKMRYVLLLSMVLALCCGCPQMREDAVIEMAKSTFIKIVDKSKIDQSTLSADGRIINPKYEFEFAAGVGPYAKGSVQVIGVEVKAEARGSGLGEATADPDLREKLYQILEMKDIARIERNKKITDTVLSFVREKTVAPALRGRVLDILASNATQEEKNRLIAEAATEYIRAADTSELEAVTSRPK